MTPILWSLALGALATACSLLALWLAWSRTSQGVADRALAEVDRTRKAWLDEVALFEAARDRWQSEFQGIAQRCHEELDQAERKRKSAAASASAANRGQPPPDQGEFQWAGRSRDEILEAARTKRRAMGV